MQFPRSLAVTRALLFSLTALALLGGFSLPLSAEPNLIRIPAEALVQSADIREVLESGLVFEAQRRWGEALSHYEDASHQYPNVAEIEHRLTLARIHYDLGRRYADRSFVEDLRHMSEDAAVDLYREVLHKIQTHYVTEPNWAEIVRRGTTHFDVALSDNVFLRRHLAEAPPERIDAFRRDLYRIADYRQVRSRADAANVVLNTARSAAQYLGMSPTAVVLEYTSGATGSLDPYSSYLTRAQLDDVYSQIEGNFVGLGVELKSENDSLLIVNTIVGSPAERSGIRAGDRIIAVDGQTTKAISADKAADILKGEEGTSVVVTVASVDGSTRDLRVRRERVEVPSIEDIKIIDPHYGIAYLKIASFQKTTSRDLDTALWRLHREGMRSLVIDVRGNPGGLLTSSVDVADKFVDRGLIVATRGRSPQEDFDYRAHQVGTWRVPLIVLIDRDTASASEIFAGAISDHQRGDVVGQRSYGKGSVQGIFPLAQTKVGVRLTTAKFYSPNGRAISKNGVAPNVPVEVAAKPITGDGASTPAMVTADATLSTALQIARRRMAGRQLAAP
jgi:carboxyl-terminal processing protease